MIKLNKISKWIITELKILIVLFPIVFGMTALTIGFLKWIGVDQYILNMGFPIVVVVYSIMFNLKRIPEKIVNWLDSKPIHDTTTK